MGTSVCCAEQVDGRLTLCDGHVTSRRVRLHNNSGFGISEVHVVNFTNV